MIDDPSDTVLVERAARGGEYAFRALYRRHVRPVYWIAHGLLGSPSEAEDVTQETFVTAWRKLGGLQLAGESLLPWLATICRFHVANRLRARSREREHIAGGERDAAAPVDVERQVVARETLDAILREVRGLGELDREILRLCAGEGLSYGEAADRLGVAHGAVRNRLSRIRTRLRTVAGEDTA